MARTPPPKRDAPKGSEPLSIHKLTLGYDRVEDRMRLDGQDSGGRVIRLWLTRRLADVIFGHLANNVLVQGTVKDPAFGRLLNTWEQQAAQAQQRGDQPVQWKGESVLVSAVEMGRSKAGTRVTFKATLAGIDYPVAQTTLSETHLRQWLGIVFRTYGVAGWPTDVWPAWLAEAQRLTDAAADKPGKP